MTNEPKRTSAGRLPLNLQNGMPEKHVKMVFYLKVYTSIPELTTVQNFLQRCFKCKYISYHTDIYNVLEEVDCSLLKKISSMFSHPLYPTVPKTKETSVCLLVPSSQLPRVNTQRFKNSFLIAYFSNIE